MDINKFTTGMIFSLDDRNYGDPNGKEIRHYYIVVGVPDQHHIQLYKCMPISSFHNREIMEVDIPILLNDKISYINATTITSFSQKRLEADDAYFGIVNDSREFTKSDIVSLLLKAFMLSNYTMLDDKTYYSIREDISIYKEKFSKIYGHKAEYRDHKVNTPINQALDDSGVKEALNIKTSKPVSSSDVKKQNKKIHTIDIMSAKEVLEFPRVQNGSKKQPDPQTAKFYTRQLYELVEGKKINQMSAKTLETIITCYNMYGSKFFIDNFARYKNYQQTHYLYDRAHERLKLIVDRESKKHENSVGGIKN